MMQPMEIGGEGGEKMLVSQGSVNQLTGEDVSSATIDVPRPQSVKLATMG